VSSYHYMCPHTTISVSSYYYAAQVARMEEKLREVKPTPYTLNPKP